MKRLIQLLIVLIAVIVLFAGCPMQPIEEEAGSTKPTEEEPESTQPTGADVEALMQQWYSAMEDMAPTLVYGETSVSNPDGSYSMDTTTWTTTYTDFAIGTSGITVSGTTVNIKMTQTDTSLDIVATMDITLTGAAFKKMTGATTISAVLSQGLATSATITGTLTVDSVDFVLDDMDLASYWIDSYNAMVSQT